MRIDAIAAGWLVKEGQGYVGQVEGAKRTVRFTHVNGKSVDWSFPSPRVARQFVGLVIRAPLHTKRPDNLPTTTATLAG